LLQCDEGRPFCRKCISTGRICPGYRDDLALRFRNQSTKSSRKPKTVEKWGNVSPTPSISIRAPLATSIEDRGNACFFSEWHIAGGDFVSKKYSYVQGISKQGQLVDALPRMVESIGLATLSSRHRSAHLLMLSRIKYAAAITTVNEALNDPNLVLEDELIATIALLGLYEVGLNLVASQLSTDLWQYQRMTCIRLPSFLDWTKHVDGLVKILQLRGSLQFHRHIGIEIFLHLRTNIVS
jgi:hypothetical protein